MSMTYVLIHVNITYYSLKQINKADSPNSTGKVVNSGKDGSSWQTFKLLANFLRNLSVSKLYQFMKYIGKHARHHRIFLT